MPRKKKRQNLVPGEPVELVGLLRDVGDRGTIAIDDTSSGTAVVLAGESLLLKLRDAVSRNILIRAGARVPYIKVRASGILRYDKRSSQYRYSLVEITNVSLFSDRTDSWIAVEL